jgi:hypothetical protein
MVNNTLNCPPKNNDKQKRLHDSEVGSPTWSERVMPFEAFPVCLSCARAFKLGNLIPAIGTGHFCAVKGCENSSAFITVQ